MPELELERKTTVCSFDGKIHSLIIHAHTYETSEKHGSPHLDDVRLSGQPAASPLPCGCFPAQLGDPSFKLMQVVLTQSH